MTPIKMKPVGLVLVVAAVVCDGTAVGPRGVFAGDAAVPPEKPATDREGVPVAAAFGPLWQPPLPAGAVRRIGWKAFAHPNLPVSAVCCSPNGKRIASFDWRGTCRGDERGLVRIWDSRTGRPLRSILLRPAAKSAGGGQTRAVVFSQDFRSAVAAMRAALEKTESVEARQRLHALLARLEIPTKQCPELLRRRRAEAILQRIGTAEALQLLRSSSARTQ